MPVLSKKWDLKFESNFHIVAVSLHILQQIMREIVHLQAGQCGNQIGAKVSSAFIC